MRKFTVAVSVSTVYEVDAENHREAVELILRHRDIGWVEGVNEVGDGCTEYQIKEQVQ